MASAFIKDRASLADASDLLDRFGEDAAREAAALAAESREAGNVVRFCHWRQIQRVIAALSHTSAAGTVH